MGNDLSIVYAIIIVPFQESLTLFIGPKVTTDAYTGIRMALIKTIRLQCINHGHVLFNNRIRNLD